MTILCFYTFSVVCSACVGRLLYLSALFVYLLSIDKCMLTLKICCSPKIDVLFVDIMFLVLHALYFLQLVLSGEKKNEKLLLVLLKLETNLPPETKSY